MRKRTTIQRLTEGGGERKCRLLLAAVGNNCEL
jgi:hypothetical protein